MAVKPNIDWNALNFAGFAKLAEDPTLRDTRKIGFPDCYRAGFETKIFADICAKLPRLNERGLTVLDIGPGCSDLPTMLINLCRARGHRLRLVDSPEMLARLPDGRFIDKRPGNAFPKCCDTLSRSRGRVAVILCYSVLHYVFVDANVFDFVDVALELLAPGGEILIGDIPNASKRAGAFLPARPVSRSIAHSPARDTCRPSTTMAVHGGLDDASSSALLARAARPAPMPTFYLRIRPANGQPARGHFGPEAMTRGRRQGPQARIVGDSAFAEVACEYFAHDFRYEVGGFAVEQAYSQRTELMGRPVVALETLARTLPPRNP